MGLMSQRSMAQQITDLSQMRDQWHRQQQATKDPHGKIVARPYTVAMASEITFGREGQIIASRNYLRVMLEVENQAPGKITFLRDVRIIKAVTNTGEEIRPMFPETSRPMREQDFLHRVMPRDDGACWLEISFEMPRDGATHLAQLHVDAQASIAMGERKTLLLKPLADYVGKRLAFKELPNRSMTLTRGLPGEPAADVYRLELTRETDPHISTFIFLDDQGEELSSSRYGGGMMTTPSQRDGNVVYVTSHMPPAAALIIRIYPEIDLKDVSFRLEHIPIVQPRPAAPDEMMLSLPTQPDAPKKENP